MKSRPGLTARLALASLLVGLTLSPGSYATGQDKGGTPSSKVREIEQRAVGISRQLRTARRLADASGARCASDKLSQIHAQLRLARRHLGLRAAATTSSERRLGERTIEVARERATEIARAARVCSEQKTLRRRVPSRRIAKR